MNTAAISFDDLRAAFDWVSASMAFENAAYISKATGQIYWVSTAVEVEDEPPADLEDGTLHVAVPHKVDLNLGKRLALAFTKEHLPQSLATVASFFRKKSAYGRFKALLDRQGMLEAWYAYEAQAIEQALREWCIENEIPIKPSCAT